MSGMAPRRLGQSTGQLDVAFRFFLASCSVPTLDRPLGWYMPRCWFGKSCGLLRVLSVLGSYLLSLASFAFSGVLFFSGPWSLVVCRLRVCLGRLVPPRACCVVCDACCVFAHVCFGHVFVCMRALFVLCTLSVLMWSSSFVLFGLWSCFSVPFLFFFLSLFLACLSVFASFVVVLLFGASVIVWFLFAVVLPLLLPAVWGLRLLEVICLFLFYVSIGYSMINYCLT